jgi:AAA15 family ATPase/GTPase
LIRLKKVVITNIKNVNYGEIDLPNETFTTEELTKSDVVGIYGQNGSGKTALVDAMWIVKSLMSGDKLPEDVANYVFQNEEKAKIELTYSLTSNNKYIIFYEVYLKKNEEDVATVVKEYLSYKKYEDNQWTRRAGIIDYDINYKDYIFKPIKNYKLIRSNNEDAQIDLRVAKKISKRDNTSFIFSNELEEIIKNKDSFSEFAMLIMAIKKYAKVNLFIIRSDHSGLINMNVLMPFSFRLLEKNRVTQGDLAVSLLKPSTIPNKIFQIIKKIICQMNIVLETIIPGMNIGIKDYGKQLTKDGEEGRRIELTSKRKDIEVPLKYESDGIRKIISILSTLITTYNNPTVCMIIDELDAGIFEYLLGEILSIISKFGKGQLIFTSHNFRPLEILSEKSLVFTTTNPNNRYMRFTNVKDTNNIKNMYYRSIDLGGQKEMLYQETKSYEIRRAFRKAGSDISEN